MMNSLELQNKSDEREACAKLAEWYADELKELAMLDSHKYQAYKACLDLADMIRARDDEQEPWSFSV